MIPNLRKIGTSAQLWFAIVIIALACHAAPGKTWADSYAKSPHVTVTVDLERNGTAVLSFQFNDLPRAGAFFSLIEFPKSAKVTSDLSAPPHVYGWLRRGPALARQEVIVGIADAKHPPVKITLSNSNSVNFLSDDPRAGDITHSFGFPRQDPIGDLDDRLQGMFVPVSKLIVNQPDGWGKAEVQSMNAIVDAAGLFEVNVKSKNQIVVHVIPRNVGNSELLIRWLFKNAGILLAIIAVLGTISAMTAQTNYAPIVRLTFAAVAVGLLLFNFTAYIDAHNVIAFLQGNSALITTNISFLVAALLYRHLDTVISKLKSYA